MSKSLFSTGGAATTTPHIHPPNKLLVEVKLVQDEVCPVDRFEMSLMSTVAQVSRGKVDCEVTVSKKSVKAIITFENPEYLDRVKKILKTTSQAETIQNGKQHMRKLSVEVVQPKKSDGYVDPKSTLPEFDPDLLKELKGKFGEPELYTDGHPSFLKASFLQRSGLFNISDIVSLKNQVQPTRRVRVYTRHDTLGAGSGSYRIAHPDCPGLVEKCLDMCGNKSTQFEYMWKYVCDMDMPETILCSPEFWKHCFRPIEK